jgi:iron complex outermembrane receptor protein
MFKLFFAITATLWSIGACAQMYSVYGNVHNEKNNRSLAGATIEIKEGNRGAVSDEYGNFRITKLQAGTYTLTIRFLGFEASERELTVDGNLEFNVGLKESSQLTDEVVVYATRANDMTPTTFSQLNKQAIKRQNFGQDLPMLLNWTPSLVTTSDAGAGIGYTGLRIRGTDATRINVTINGIALNDSESQGVFWVNTPDLASSVQNIQVQRGVGTSTNGPGAFGATVNVLTDALSADAYAEVMASAGSFRSQRYTFKAGTGLMNSRWAFDGRISTVRSDGYLERATSDLNSYYLSGGYYGKKTIVKAIMFGGKEKTYQAWYGIDAGTLATNRRFNYAGAIYDNDGNVIQYYDNEVDHYAQNHYQLHFSNQLTPYWNATMAVHYTSGRGYYEQYKQSEAFSNLGLPNVIIGAEEITASDVIVRRWLDNDYYGTTFSLHYNKKRTDLTVGGAMSHYGNARHFGEIVWAEIALNSPIRYVYYDGESEKTDINLYGKLNYTLSDKFSMFLDFQFRSIRYSTAGKDNDQSQYAVDDRFNFVNPKAGISYALGENNQLYASYGIANREPNRSDYLDGIEKPKRERLGNLEVGWRQSSDKFAMEANYYLMHYDDQLVLTGEVNDTGYPIRANVGKSFRTGIELSGGMRLGEKINWNANVTWSVNKNLDFAVFDENNIAFNRNTTIILSPSWVAGSDLTWKAFANFQSSLLSKYVGKQYLDNTQDENVTLDGYLIHDVRMSYTIQPPGNGQIQIGLLINNILDVDYASNGYGYGGSAYFFPQAGINFMGMLTVKL